MTANERQSAFDSTNAAFSCRQHSRLKTCRHEIDSFLEILIFDIFKLGQNVNVAIGHSNWLLMVSYILSCRFVEIMRRATLSPSSGMHHQQIYLLWQDRYIFWVGTIFCFMGNFYFMGFYRCACRPTIDSLFD